MVAGRCASAIKVSVQYCRIGRLSTRVYIWNLTRQPAASAEVARMNVKAMMQGQIHDRRWGARSVLWGLWTPSCPVIIPSHDSIQAVSRGPRKVVIQARHLRVIGRRLNGRNFAAIRGCRQKPMKDVLRGNNIHCINVHTHIDRVQREIQPLQPDLVSLVVILADAATNCEQRALRV